jgi:hypothetical protein
MLLVNGLRELVVIRVQIDLANVGDDAHQRSRITAEAAGP